MALVTTIGASSANSYITVAEADTILDDAAIWDMAAWDALEDTAKEYRLLLAAALMNQFSWAAYPIYTNQALAFPRWWTDEDDIEIPDAITQAQAFIAYDVIHRGTVGITAPSTGISKAPIKSLSLFSAISITRADGALGAADATSLESWIRSNHFPIYLLMAPYQTQVTVIPGPTGPDLLDEVA